MFELAEQLGKTVGELEGVVPGLGMSETELLYWKALNNVRRREAARRPSI
jgi:hypothetical protein